MRGALRGVAVGPGSGGAVLDPAAELRRQRPLRRGPVLHGVDALAERGRHPHDARQVLQAGTAPALPVVAGEHRDQPHAPTHVERPRPGGPAELVAGDRKQVGAESGRVDGQTARGLTRVGVEQDVPGVGEVRRLRHRLDRSDLVVGVLHRRDGRPGGADLGGEPVHVHAAVLVNRRRHDLPIRSRAEHSGVLHRPEHDPACGRPVERERHRLGPARGEDDLVRLRADGVGHGLPGLRQQPLRRPAPFVEAEGITDRLSCLIHGTPSRSGQGRRGMVIEVAFRHD